MIFRKIIPPYLDEAKAAQSFIHKYVKDSVIADALNAYLDYAINRKK